VATSADGVSGRAQNGQDRPDDEQDDADGPQDGDFEYESSDEQDESENDHGEPLCVVEIASAGRLRDR